jgi:hypothetical protein
MARMRAYIAFSFVAIAQLMCPAAAADPASKIDPPAWSYKHTQDELQAYGIAVNAEIPEEITVQSIREARLRRLLRQPKSEHR